jgi:hypothetical protein
VANGLFTSYKNSALGTGTHVDLDADTIKAMGVDHADDTPVPATDDFINDIASAARVPAIATCALLGGKLISGGAFDSTDPVFATLSGDQFESLILFKDTGVEGTSDLIVFYDTATGLPLTPNGADLTVIVHASGWWVF